MVDENAVIGFKRMKHKLLALKLELMLFGLLALFIGTYPFLFEKGLLPSVLHFLPMDGTGYRTVIMALGGLAFLLGFRTTRH